MDADEPGRPIGDAREDAGPADPAQRASADQDEESDGVITAVCLKCGSEYFFDQGGPPEGLTCRKCGNTVFRSYFSHETEDEAAEEFRAETERDLRPDDAEGDTLPGDLLDLDPDRR